MVLLYNWVGLWSGCWKGYNILDLEDFNKANLNILSMIWSLKVDL